MAGMARGAAGCPRRGRSSDRSQSLEPGRCHKSSAASGAGPASPPPSRFPLALGFRPSPLLHSGSSRVRLPFSCTSSLCFSRLRGLAGALGNASGGGSGSPRPTLGERGRPGPVTGLPPASRVFSGATKLPHPKLEGLVSAAGSPLEGFLLFHLYQLPPFSVSRISLPFSPSSRSSAPFLSPNLVPPLARLSQALPLSRSNSADLYPRSPHPTSLEGKQEPIFFPSPRAAPQTPPLIPLPRPASSPHN